MSLLADDRAQSIQVGAVLLFAILVIAFSTYQAFIVPEQNASVEFEHNQEVQSQLGDLRGAIVATQDGGSTHSTTVDLGTRYPSRAVALNPGSPSGTLRTVGTSNSLVNLTIENANATGGAGDFWNGDRRQYNTGGFSYEPNYNRYAEAPETAYEHTVLYNDFGEESLVEANQTFLEGDRLSIVTLNGSIDRSTSSATTVDTRPTSSSDRTVLVEGSEPSPITISFTSRLPGDWWERTLSDRNQVVEDSIEAVDSPAGPEYDEIRFELRHEQGYELAMTKAGVGTGVTDEEPAYVTPVASGETVAPAGETELTFEVRDAYNNPVPGHTVHGDVGTGGASVEDEVTTDEDGRATFTFDAAPGASTGTYPVNVTTGEATLLDLRPFDGDSALNETVDVDVSSTGSGGGGAYEVTWADPGEDNTGDALDCGPDSCAWDVGASDDDTLSLNARVEPPFEGIGLEFAVDDQDVANVSAPSGDTGHDGAEQTTLTAEGDGTVNVLASASDDSDVIEIEVENVTGDGSGSGQVLQPVEMRDSTDRRFVFRIENAGTEQVTVEEFAVDVAGAQDNVALDNDNGAELQILRSTQESVANRNGNPTNFDPDGTYYDLVEDSNQGNEGAYAIIGPDDDTVDVDFREFQPGIGHVTSTDSEADADVVVDLVLSDGSVQEFYFEYT